MARAVDRDAKRLKILEVAATLFAEAGYEATAMAGVAAAAGVSKGSLYDYFKNKEDLFYAVFEWFQQRVLRGSLERMADGATMREKLTGVADASVGALMDEVALYPVMLEVWAAAAKTGTRARFAHALQALYTDFRAQIGALIGAAQRQGEVRPDIDAAALAGVLVGAVDGLLLQYWLDPSFDPRGWVKSFFDALFDGIAIETKE